MPAPATAEELLRVARASPAAVAIHDRAAWVALFSSEGQVNDPVGSRPHTGHAAIARFYDTFIAPNGIRFQVNQDVVCGGSVVRDLSIETTMSTGVKLLVPMHLRYEIAEEAGQLKIRRLYAHWELLQMIAQLLRQGFKGWWTAAKLGPQMIAHQGLGGVFGFMRGFFGVGAVGKRTAGAFLDALQRGDAAAVQSLAVAGVVLEWPASQPLSLTQLLDQTRGLEWRKPIAAGAFVTVTVRLAGGTAHGVALFRFAPSRRQITSASFFI